MSGIHLEVPSSCEEAKWQLRVEKTFLILPSFNWHTHVSQVMDCLSGGWPGARKGDLMMGMNTACATFGQHSCSEKC